MRFPRGWLRLNNHFELPLTLMRLDRMMAGRGRGDEWRDPHWRTMVLNQVIDDLARHANELTILSAEDLSLFRYDDELAALRAVTGDADIIAYLRRPIDFLASMAAHYQKPGMPGLSPTPDAYNYLEPGTWRTDYGTLIAAWRRHFTTVHALDYDAITTTEGSIIPSFLRHVGITSTLDTTRYRLNRRDDPIPRTAGNRITTGQPFGVPA